MILIEQSAGNLQFPQAYEAAIPKKATDACKSTKMSHTVETHF
jgi:hypothetical protein